MVFIREIVRFGVSKSSRNVIGPIILEIGYRQFPPSKIRKRLQDCKTNRKTASRISFLCVRDALDGVKTSLRNLIALPMLKHV